jgi:3'(2'), 5'-bisphosphate nucleotidase
MERVLSEIEPLAIAAGAAIMSIYTRPIHVEEKADASPVTQADAQAEAIILAGLRRCYPGIPVVAEEECAAGRTPDLLGTRFFLVDPLDGTKEFINRRDEFTVNIALVEEGVPIIGVVYAPALGILYAGTGSQATKRVLGAGRNDGMAQVERIAVRSETASRVAVASRSHAGAATATWLDQNGIANTVSVGSSLKFCLIAEGVADVYPRLGRTMEWDTAAGDAILRAAGGSVRTLDGVPLVYGKRNQSMDVDFANPHFIASAL